MTGPRYLVWISTSQFFLCDSLAVACDRKSAFGGTIYEPLGMTTAEKVCIDSDDRLDHQLIEILRAANS